MAKVIPVSFKETSKDKSLYDRVIKQGDKSNFVKECIEFYLKYRDKELKVVEVQKPAEVINTEVKNESIDPRAKAALSQFWGDDE